MILSHSCWETHFQWKACALPADSGSFSKCVFFFKEKLSGIFLRIERSCFHNLQHLRSSNGQVSDVVRTSVSSHNPHRNPVCLISKQINITPNSGTKHGFLLLTAWYHSQVVHWLYQLTPVFQPLFDCLTLCLPVTNVQYQEFILILSNFLFHASDSHLPPFAEAFA